MIDTILVQRANVLLRVTPEEKDKYVAQGYNVIDESGKVIEKSVPTDVRALQRAFVEHEAEITELKAELVALRLALKTKDDNQESVKPKRKTKEVS